MAYKINRLLTIARGMHSLHQRPQPILHHDLKLDNILLSAGGQWKISDFGFAEVKTHITNSSNKSSKGMETLIHIALDTNILVGPLFFLFTSLSFSSLQSRTSG